MRHLGEGVGQAQHHPAHTQQPRLPPRPAPRRRATASSAPSCVRIIRRSATRAPHRESAAASPAGRCRQCAAPGPSDQTGTLARRRHRGQQLGFLITRSVTGTRAPGPRGLDPMPSPGPGDGLRGNQRVTGTPATGLVTPSWRDLDPPEQMLPWTHPAGRNRSVQLRPSCWSIQVHPDPGCTSFILF